MKLISFSQIKLIIGSALFFCIAFISTQPKEKKRFEYIPPPRAVKNLMVGMKYAFADSLWLRAIQDFDYCEQKVNEFECQSKSWLFQILDLATEVDPVFEPTMYKSGGLALSVIISDYAGATVIFDKAVAQYPKDWHMAYVAAYHALYDLKDKLKAAHLYEQAAKNGAPPWVFTLAGRLAADKGDIDYSRKILEEMIATNKDEIIINRLKQKIAQMESSQSQSVEKDQK